MMSYLNSEPATGDVHISSPAPDSVPLGYHKILGAVKGSLLDTRSEGVDKAILFPAESNLVAQRAYTALRFRHGGDYRILLLQSPISVGC